MSEEAPTEHFEHAEHAEHAAHEGTPFLLSVSVMIAILAILAASVGSLEMIETAATLIEQNAACLLQNKSSEQWADFQAKSIKKNADDIAARQGGSLSQEFARRSATLRTGVGRYPRQGRRKSKSKSSSGCMRRSGTNIVIIF